MRERIREKCLVYIGPEERLFQHLERINQHRQHVATELARLERFLLEHPELKHKVSPSITHWGPRLVVDNEVP
jgi:hypothetical protein